jgi:ParB family chromosome partitioning protein
MFALGPLRPENQILTVRSPAPVQRATSSMAEGLLAIAWRKVTSTSAAKRPTPSSTGRTLAHYGLVCGQGRLEACMLLGQREIPAIAIAAAEAECLVMNLVESCARHQHRAIDLLQDI